MLDESSHAWAKLEPSLGKLKHAIVGADLHRSSPQFFARLHDLGKLRVHAGATPDFGPNVYEFRAADEVVVIVGCAPLDQHALESEFQAAVLTRCDRTSRFALSVAHFLHRCLIKAVVPTREDLAHYAQSHASCSPALERARIVHWRRPPVDLPDDPLDDDLLEDNLDDEMMVDRRDFSPKRTTDDSPAIAADDLDEQADDQEEFVGDDETDDSGDPGKPTPLDDVERGDAMAAFRKAGRELGEATVHDYLRWVARQYGYERLGKKVAATFRGLLKLAKRHRIVEQLDNGNLRPAVTDIADYSSSELVAALVAAVGRSWLPREQAIREAALLLGFTYVTTKVDDVLRGAIKTGLRLGELQADGNEIRRPR
ncbi:MAG TPA: hypothetical protein PLV92_16240 [Pirellulaceae bacterium]|nr:hypothetical protein [Pirellulaceae bacterium]